MYSKIYNKIWQHKIFRNLSDNAKTLYLYLISSPHGNLLGLYYLPYGYISADLRWGRYRIRTSIIDLVENGFISWCEDTSMVRIHNFLKYQPLSNPNVVTSATRTLLSMPSPSVDLMLELHEDVIKELELEKKYYEPLAQCINERISDQDKPFNTMIYVKDTNRQHGDKKIIDAPQVSQEINNKINSASTEDSFLDDILNLDDVEVIFDSDEAEKSNSHHNKSIFIDEEDNSRFSLILDDGSLFCINNNYLEELKRKFANIDVEEQLDRMSFWCENRKEKRKTKRGITRFILTWLSNHQAKVNYNDPYSTNLQPFASDEVKDIFNLWYSKINMPETRLNNSRIKLIQSSLKNYSAESIRKAIKGCFLSDFHQGYNSRKTAYNDIAFILSTPERIENFIKIFEKHHENFLEAPASSNPMIDDLVKEIVNS